MRTFIKAIAYYLPERVLDNQQIANEFPEWTVEKIDKKIGIKKRHITTENETAGDMAVKAAEKLFSENKIERSTIDYLIFVSQSADYFLPTTACLIQERLELRADMAAIDINLGCSGFVYGLSVAKGMILGGMATNVLLLTAETYSKYLHPRDKSNRTIFGDAAAATLVSAEGIAEIGNFVFGTDGKGADNLVVKTGAARHRFPMNDLQFDDFGNPRSSDHLYMDGPAILNYSLECIPALVENVLVKNNLRIENVDLHVYHQANKYLANLQCRKLRIPEEKYYCYFEKVGNTVSSTIPIALYEAYKEGMIKSGFRVLSVAQGLGYSWGGMVLYY